MNQQEAGPLAGLNVFEIGHIMASPVCGLMLADLGANVIKVERFPGGDPARDMVPPRVDGESAAFMMLNRNKRGIAVDLKRPNGRAVLLRLLRGADVLIENYRAGAMQRLGLSYETLRAENSGLIYCEISGFGRTGPYAELGGFDLIAQGYSGLMSVTGEGPGRPPVKCGAPLTDITAGILAALGILAACLERGKTGVGQRVDTSLFEAGIIHTYWQSAIALATGQSPGAMGSAHPLSAPYEAFQTADGWITIGASSEASWARLVEVLERRDLQLDARFETNADRMSHRPELVQILSDIFRQRSTADWLMRLETGGVPAGPVLSVGEMLAHPQTIARQMVVDIEHQTLGSMKTIGTPMKLSASKTGVRRSAPILGQHTRIVMREHGFSDAEIDDLVREGAVYCADEQGDR